MFMEGFERSRIPRQLVKESTAIVPFFCFEFTLSAFVYFFICSCFGYSLVSTPYLLAYIMCAPVMC